MLVSDTNGVREETEKKNKNERERGEKKGRD